MGKKSIGQVNKNPKGGYFVTVVSKEGSSLSSHPRFFKRKSTATKFRTKFLQGKRH